MPSPLQCAVQRLGVSRLPELPPCTCALLHSHPCGMQEVILVPPFLCELKGLGQRLVMCRLRCNALCRDWVSLDCLSCHLVYALFYTRILAVMQEAEEEPYSIWYWYDDRSSDQRWSLAAASTGVAESGAKILSKGRWSVYNMYSLA